MPLCDGSSQTRPVAEGEQLAVHRFLSGSVGLAAMADIRREEVSSREAVRSIWQKVKRYFARVPPDCHPIPEVYVPSGTYLILRAIPGYIQQKYGLQKEEGAIFLQNGAAGSDSLRFNNDTQVRLDELRLGQPVEVLSLAGIHPVFYEPELEMQASLR